MRPPMLPSVVVVARNFNPTIFTQLWLVRHNIFTEKEVQENFIFTPMAVNLTTPDCAFLAIPDRIQLGFINDTVDQPKLIDRTLGQIVSLLPETPFTAVGFNLGWTLSPKIPDEFAKINRKYFLSSEDPLAKFFQESSCRFGSYFSKDVAMGRLRLDIKPVIVPATSGSSDALQLAFNFNLDLKEGDKPKQVLEFLASWNTALSISSEMVETIGAGWAN